MPNDIVYVRVFKQKKYLKISFFHSNFQKPFFLLFFSEMLSKRELRSSASDPSPTADRRFLTTTAVMYGGQVSKILLFIFLKFSDQDLRVPNLSRKKIKGCLFKVFFLKLLDRVFKTKFMFWFFFFKFVFMFFVVYFFVILKN